MSEYIKFGPVTKHVGTAVYDISDEYEIVKKLKRGIGILDWRRSKGNERRSNRVYIGMHHVLRIRVRYHG